MAIVTGTSAGIGRATAFNLANEFTGLVWVGRDENELVTTAAGQRDAK